MDFRPIYSPPALLRVEHEEVVLCLAQGKQKPSLSPGCRPFAGLFAEMWYCSVDQALAQRTRLWSGDYLLLSVDNKGTAVITCHPELLPRWSSTSLLGETLPAVQTSDLLKSRSCLDSSPEVAEGLSLWSLQDKRGVCSSVWSPGSQAFAGRQCCICTQLLSFPSACASGQCWLLLSHSASPWPAGLRCSSHLLPDFLFSSFFLLQAPL